ncbi:hypothetical protein, partial [Sporichthya sp.]|uniref:hypothetical protein n=1 Tax=Sporichthya sp. TaxID=65475 RepID=UPI00181B51B8
MTRLTRLVAAGIGIAAVPGWMLGIAPAVKADSASAAYDAFANASAFEVSIANPSLPALPALVGGGPEADARQSSSGQGDANASTPYTGDTVPGVPGVAGALFGLPVPPFPFIASSTRGTPPVRTSYPGVELTARSDDFSTAAKAVLGSDGAGANASARVDQNSAGDVVARAVTEASNLQIGALMSLSNFRTIAETKADGFTGKITRFSSTSIGGIDVPGLVLRLPEQSPGKAPLPVPIPGVPNQEPLDLPPFPVPMGGTTLSDPKIGLREGTFTLTQPVDGKPQTFALPTQPVLDAFKAAGVTLTYQSASQLPKGISSGTYTFRYTIPAPPPNSGYNGPTDVIQSTGAASALVDFAVAGQAATTGGPGVSAGPA